MNTILKMNNNNQDDIEMLHNLDYLNKANYINLNNNQNDKKKSINNCY